MRLRRSVPISIPVVHLVYPLPPYPPGDDYVGGACSERLRLQNALRVEATSCTELRKENRF